MKLHFAWTELRNFAIILAVFLIIDGVWLLVIAKKLYAQYLGYLMAEKPKLLAALVFYLLFVLGLLAFVVNPALAAGSWTAALLPGLLFGLITYATYDLTNLATVKDWPVLITVIDLAWAASSAAQRRPSVISSSVCFDPNTIKSCPSLSFGLFRYSKDRRFQYACTWIH